MASFLSGRCCLCCPDPHSAHLWKIKNRLLGQSYDKSTFFCSAKWKCCCIVISAHKGVQLWCAGLQRRTYHLFVEERGLGEPLTLTQLQARWFPRSPGGEQPSTSEENRILSTAHPSTLTGRGGGVFHTQTRSPETPCFKQRLPWDWAVSFSSASPPHNMHVPSSR